MLRAVFDKQDSKHASPSIKMNSGSSSSTLFQSRSYMSTLYSTLEANTTSQASSCSHENHNSHAFDNSSVPSQTSVPPNNGKNGHLPSPWYHQMIAGALAGGSAAFFVSPLDVARVRIQISKVASADSGLFGISLMRKMIATEGVLSLYKGLSANLIALVPNWMAYFVAYSQFKQNVHPLLTPTLGHAPVDILNAVFAGAVSTVVAHPLWLVKARMQVQGLQEALPSMSAEGMLKRQNGKHSDLFLASKAAVANVSPSHSTVPDDLRYWGKVSNYTHVLHDLTKHETTQPPTVDTHAPPRVTNGVGQSSTTATATSAPRNGDYQNTFRALRTIIRTEGVKGLYHGFVPQLFGLVHAGIHFPLYESFKRRLHEYNLEQHELNIGSCTKPHNGHSSGWCGSCRHCRQGRPHTLENDTLSTSQIIIASTMSKVLACAVAYPHEVLRSRFQTQDFINIPKHERYTSVRGAVKHILATEGVQGLYRGLGVTLFRSVPACIVTFVVYEHVLNSLRGDD